MNVFSLVFVIIVLGIKIVFAGGIIGPGEIFLSGVEIGKTVHMSSLRGSLFKVINKSEVPVNIQIYIEKPLTTELKTGCECLPDINWVKVEKSTWTVPPDSTLETEIFISVPNKKKFSNKKYQFFVISETLPSGAGMVYGLAIKTRVIFTTVKRNQKGM